MADYSQLTDREIAEKTLEALENLTAILEKVQKKFPFILGR